MKFAALFTAFLSFHSIARADISECVFNDECPYPLICTHVVGAHDNLPVPGPGLVRVFKTCRVECRSNRDCLDGYECLPVEGNARRCSNTQLEALRAEVGRLQNRLNLIETKATYAQEIWASVLSRSTSVSLPVPAPASWRVGSNFSGADFRSFPLLDPSPYECEAACKSDSRCRAWTFVNPGIQSFLAMCWLKDSIPASTNDAQTVSGIVAH